jgi:hypothetical protein
MKAFGTRTLSITQKEIEKSGIFELQRQNSESAPSNILILQMDYKDLFILLISIIPKYTHSCH